MKQIYVAFLPFIVLYIYSILLVSMHKDESRYVSSVVLTIFNKSMSYVTT